MTQAGVNVLGGGLAGCEAAWMLARLGVPSVLREMRPGVRTPAHVTGHLAELVCSNSFRSSNPSNAVGLLKLEMKEMGSLTMEVAGGCRIPAGDALAVDRDVFSRAMTAMVESEPLIGLARGEVAEPEPDIAVIIATGPLTSDRLASWIASVTGAAQLYFYDAIAPVVAAESLDMSVVFRQSRYVDGEGDYLNCPLDAAEYRVFVDELLGAGTVPLHHFEKEIHFSGCMPVEAIAASGPGALAFGPMKPVGLVDPRTGERPHAVVQLRSENAAGTAWNLVGFQTKLTRSEQRRVLHLIPGLEKAEFLRYGSMHRNTFVNGPALLDPTLRLRGREEISFAGQITGVEGYVESAACGMLAGLFAAMRMRGLEPAPPPAETAMGSLLRHATSSSWRHYTPSNVNYGLFPPLGRRLPPAARNEAYSARARKAFGVWLDGLEAACRISQL